MTVIEGVLLEEKERNLIMQSHYLHEISMLPKGVIVKKSKNNRDYYYLAYRDGNKVISKYLGKEIDKIHQIQQNIDKRKYLENLVKKLKKELKLIGKIIK